MDANSHTSPPPLAFPQTPLRQIPHHSSSLHAGHYAMPTPSRSMPMGLPPSLPMTLPLPSPAHDAGLGLGCNLGLDLGQDLGQDLGYSPLGGFDSAAYGYADGLDASFDMFGMTAAAYYSDDPYLGTTAMAVDPALQAMSPPPASVYPPVPDMALPQSIPRSLPTSLPPSFPAVRPTPTTPATTSRRSTRSTRSRSRPIPSIEADEEDAEEEEEDEHGRPKKGPANPPAPENGPPPPDPSDWRARLRYCEQAPRKAALDAGLVRLLEFPEGLCARELEARRAANLRFDRVREQRLKDRNNEAAKRSRQRKVARIEAAERRIIALQRDRAALAGEVAVLRRRLAAAESRVEGEEQDDNAVDDDDNDAKKGEGDSKDSNGDEKDARDRCITVRTRD